MDDPEESQKQRVTYDIDPEVATHEFEKMKMKEARTASRNNLIFNNGSHKNIPEAFNEHEDTENNKDDENKEDNQDSKGKEVVFETAKDLRREDRTKRTVFHRAALEQNSKLLKELCKKINEPNLVDKKKEFIDKPDIFNNTPLICACMQKIENQEKNRLDCIKTLLDEHPDIGIKNRRTRWTALNWCAYHGDDGSIGTMFEDTNFNPCFPDYNGLFPIDIAGGMKHKRVVRLLIRKLIVMFETYEREKLILDESTLNLRYSKTAPYLESIQLRTSCLYWGIKYVDDNDKDTKNEKELKTVKQNIEKPGEFRKLIKRIMNLGNVLPEMPMHQDFMRNCFHVACEENEIEILEELYNFRGMQKEIKFDKKLFEIKEEELKSKFYSKNFLSNWKKLNTWLLEFHKTLSEGEKIRPYDYQDFFGNTPLHIASFKGFADCAEFLLDRENKEGWRCLELRQHPNIKKLYEEYQKKLKENKKKIIKKGTQTAQILPSLKTVGSIAGNLDLNHENYFETRLIPDVVIYFKIPEHDPSKLMSMNFTMKVLSESFQSYLFMGIDKKKYILMIKLDENRLSNECMKLGLKMKLLNSYDYEVYDETRKTDFEPFRSRQRQEITMNALKKIIDVDQLTDQNIINKIYLMHTVSGAHRIQEVWLSLKRLQPLVEFRDYFTEGKHINFKGLTLLRQYFGEKSAFFFAWCSFCVIYFLPLAIPGVIVAAFAYKTNFSGVVLHLMIPIWVLYNVLVTTLVTEKWKRKEAEIATRWGVLDLLNNENVEKQLRKEFIGDEVISDVTGSITKKSEKNLTAIIFILSIPIFILLLAGVVAVFIYTNNNKDISKFIGGIINGVVITVLNYIYGTLARFFVAEENHKYQSSYERSLIIKTFLFKFLNSFLGVFYIAFYQSDTTLSSLSDTLLSLIITRQASSYLTASVIPQVSFWWRKRQYFETVEKEAQHADLNRSSASADKTDGKTHTLKRAVLDCTLGENSKFNWELAQVELESLKNTEKDLIDHYGDMLIQIGYFTMFAAAFPIGPLIAIFLNLILVRGKLKAFLTALKRPIAQKSGGLGDWLAVWEIMSVISIYTNAALLYFRTDITFYNEGEGDSRLWVYMIAIHIVLISKYMVIFFIADKPKWVTTEEEKQEYMQEKAIE